MEFRQQVLQRAMCTDETGSVTKLGEALLSYLGDWDAAPTAVEGVAAKRVQPEAAEAHVRAKIYVLQRAASDDDAYHSFHEDEGGHTTRDLERAIQEMVEDGFLDDSASSFDGPSVKITAKGYKVARNSGWVP